MEGYCVYVFTLTLSFTSSSFSTCVCVKVVVEVVVEVVIHNVIEANEHNGKNVLTGGCVPFTQSIFYLQYKLEVMQSTEYPQLIQYHYWTVQHLLVLPHCVQCWYVYSGCFQLDICKEYISRFYFECILWNHEFSRLKYHQQHRIKQMSHVIKRALSVNGKIFLCSMFYTRFLCLWFKSTQYWHEMNLVQRPDSRISIQQPYFHC